MQVHFYPKTSSVTKVKNIFGNSKALLFLTTRGNQTHIFGIFFTSSGSAGMMRGGNSGSGSGNSVNSGAITAGVVIGAVLIVIILVGAFLYTKRQ